MAEQNLEAIGSDFFSSSVSGTGEEELLRIASKFSLQLSANQIKIISYLEYIAYLCEEKELYTQQKQLIQFSENYKLMKQHNNSEAFVMRALDSISLRKLINENTLKIDIAKK